MNDILYEILILVKITMVRCW